MTAAAIVDIGSNSVRLVMYQCDGNHAQPVFNEKAACLLGERFTADGALDDAACAMALSAARRYAQLIRARSPDVVEAVATAALRRATNGEAFAHALSDALGVPVRVLSGHEEATLAARGVQAGSYFPSGLVVDMGGGSTELATIDTSGAIHALASLPIGSLDASACWARGGRRALRALYAKHLHDAAVPQACTQGALYAVGGSFRALARHHMKRTRYPLHIVHDYALSEEALESLARGMLRQQALGKRFAGIAVKRQDAALPSVHILLHLMEYMQLDEVVFSSAGIREGLISQHLSGTELYDPLLAMVRAIPVPGPHAGYAAALHRWITSVMPVAPEEIRLVRAFCELSEMATVVHPDYRAEYAFERMIATAGYGITHPQQVMLALALYHRHRARLKLNHPALELVGARHRHFAYALGQLADMAYTLSAGSEALLSCYRVVSEPLPSGGVSLHLEAQGQDATSAPLREQWQEGLAVAVSALMAA